jgi:hypothetical protein
VREVHIVKLHTQIGVFRVDVRNGNTCAVAAEFQAVDARVHVFRVCEDACPRGDTLDGKNPCWLVATFRGKHSSNGGADRFYFVSAFLLRRAGLAVHLLYIFGWWRSGGRTGVEVRILGS